MMEEKDAELRASKASAPPSSVPLDTNGPLQRLSAPPFSVPLDMDEPLA